MVLQFFLSLRDLEEVMAEGGLAVDHTTIGRWVQRYGPLSQIKLRLLPISLAE